MVRVNSTMQNLIIDGQEYLGLGILGAISALEEKSDGQSVGYTLQLNGIPEYVTVNGQKKRAADFFSEQNVQGRRSRVYIGFTNSKWQVVATKCINVGFMDAQDLSLGTISLTCESRPIDWQRPRVRYLTNNDQQLFNTGDTLLKYVSAIPGITLKWGRV
jgi:hypothetical protein